MLWNNKISLNALLIGEREQSNLVVATADFSLYKAVSQDDTLSV